MKLSTKSRYALEGLLYLAAYFPDKPITARQVAEGVQVSVPYMEQIFFTLKQAGLLKAVRGARGGFLLAIAAEQITAGMIIRAIEGDLAPVACVHNLDACNSKVRDVCVSRRLWSNVTKPLNLRWIVQP